MPGGSWRGGESFVRGGGRQEHGGLGARCANREQVRDGPKAVELCGEGARAQTTSASVGSKCGSGQQARARAPGAVGSAGSRGRRGRARWGSRGAPGHWRVEPCKEGLWLT